MARPGQDPVDKDDVPWWMKFAGRGVGTIGGFSKYFLNLGYKIYLTGTMILVELVTQFSLIVK